MGNAENDILIAGLLNFDEEKVSIDAIMSKWTGTDRSYEPQIENSQRLRYWLNVLEQNHRRGVKWRC